jgi:hypothetical protein
MGADENRLRHILTLARACVHRGQAYQAFGHLQSIESDIEDLAGTSVWAEHLLTYAGALGAMKDSADAAEQTFNEALKRISALEEPDLALEMLGHEDYGKYLAERRAFKRARNHYGLAERIAEGLDQSEDVARIQLCVIRIDLEERRDPRLRAFQRLKEAAKDGYTHIEQLEAWIHYTVTFQKYGTQVVATRKGDEASVEYFRGVLSLIRRRRSEVVK